MPLFANENRFDAEIQAATAVFTAVPPSLVKATIAAESGFRPDVVRGEPAIGDASYGLMQLLYSTAQKVGYTGPKENLLTPMVSIYYGTKLLAENYRIAKNWPDAISAYNGGFRGNLGFGSKATKPLRVCLWWKAKDVCGKWHNTPVGEYSNQAYVNKVLWYKAQYEGKPLVLPKPGEVVKPYTPPSGKGALPVVVLLAAAGVAALFVLQATR
jgi:hypothetical protein